MNPENEKKLLRGKPVAEHVLQSLAKDIQLFKKSNVTPTLRVVLVGDDSASAIYTRNKAKKCAELGMDGEVLRLPSTISTEELCSYVRQLDAEKTVHGILVQLPLPAHIDTQAVLHCISPEKDVDGFHTENVGKLQKMHPSAHIPCTAKGIWEMLQFYNVKTAGSHVVILGRSEIVGRPLATLLSSKHKYGNATVTLCHSATRDISFYTKHADIIIAAMGKPHYITRSMVSHGATIIDVGINRIDTPTEEKKYKLVGDVDFDSVIDIVSAITPVPGGVGPMTIAMLMSNTLHATKMQMS